MAWVVVTIVIGDGDDEGIVAVEVGVGGVRPGTGFGVDGSGTVAGAVAGCDGEVGESVKPSAESAAERVPEMEGDVFCAGA